MMKTSDFNFDLPQELIAQDPLEDRSSSRLMVLNKESGEIAHRIFHDITEYLHPGDCLVINDTRVLPARLHGERVGTGAHIEVLLLVRKSIDTWEVLSPSWLQFVIVTVVTTVVVMAVSGLATQAVIRLRSRKAENK